MFLKKMTTSDHSVGKTIDKIVINLADDATDLDDSSCTETARMGHATDTTSGTE